MLRLSANAIGDAATPAVCSLLGASPCLQALALADNGLSDASARQLAAPLALPSCALTSSMLISMVGR